MFVIAIALEASSEAGLLLASVGVEQARAVRAERAAITAAGDSTVLDTATTTPSDPTPGDEVATSTEQDFNMGEEEASDSIENEPETTAATTTDGVATDIDETTDTDIGAANQSASDMVESGIASSTVGN